MRVGEKVRTWTATGFRFARQVDDSSERYFRQRPWQKFVWQTSKSLAVIVAFCALTRKFPEQPAERFWIVLYLSPIILIATIVGLVLLGRRYGASAVASIFAAIAVLAVPQYLMLRWYASRAQRWQEPTTMPAYGPGQRIDLSSILVECNDFCVAVLANTSYSVVLGSAVYVKAQGPICSTDENRHSHLLFLGYGIANTCAIHSTLNDESTDLVIEQIYYRAWSDHGRPDDLPRSFQGDVYEIRERRDGVDRVLGRQMNGSVRGLSGWFGLLGLDAIRVGKPVMAAHVMTLWLGIPMHQWHVAANIDLPSVLDELEQLLDDPTLQQEALAKHTLLVDMAGKNYPSSLQARVERLLNDSRSVRIRAGLRMVSHTWKFDLIPVEGRVRQLAASDNSQIRKAAERILAEFGKQQ